MNLCVILIFLLFMHIIKSLNLRSMESVVDQNNLLKANGIDIVKFLNLNEVLLAKNSTEVQEAEILKHKMKKSDIESFENYLDSYLKLLRKFKKNSSLSISAYKNSSSHEEKNISTNKTINNNLNNFINKSIDLNNNTKSFRNSSDFNLTISKNMTEKIRNKNESIGNETKSTNVTNNKINSFFLSSSFSNTTKNSSIVNVNVNVNITTNNTYQITKSNNTVVSSNYPTFNHTRSENKTTTNKSLIINNINKNNNNNNLHDYKRVLISDKNNSTNEKVNYNLSLADGEKLKDIDSIYFHLKKVKFNEDFERRERQVENEIKEKLTSTKSDRLSAEYNEEKNIYRNVVNISLSLIVIGLLMGILIGLIIVMYFSSKNE